MSGFSGFQWVNVQVQKRTVRDRYSNTNTKIGSVSPAFTRSEAPLLRENARERTFEKLS